MKKKKFTKHLSWLIPVVLIGFGIILLSNPSEPIEGMQQIDDLGNAHIDSVESEHIAYNSNPPTSGPHVGNIAPWGVSKEIIPDELQVHNLEDGGIMIQYNPDKIAKEDIQQIESMVRFHEHIIVAPRYDMDYPIAVTAWNVLLPLDQIEEEKIKAFVDRYAGLDHHARF